MNPLDLPRPLELLLDQLHHHLVGNELAALVERDDLSADGRSGLDLLVQQGTRGHVLEAVFAGECFALGATA